MLLLYVELPDMGLEVGAVVGPVGAIWALKWPLPSMDANMCHQIKFLEECLATIRASMTQPRPKPLGPLGRGCHFL